MNIAENIYGGVVDGPVDSNQVRLYNKILSLVQGLYGVLHTKVNGMGAGVEEVNGTASGVGWCGWDGTGDTEKGRGRNKWERSTVEEVGGGENTTVGRECTGVWGQLHGGEIGAMEETKHIRQFGSDCIAYKSAGMEDLSRC